MGEGQHQYCDISAPEWPIQPIELLLLVLLWYDEDRHEKNGFEPFKKELEIVLTLRNPTHKSHHARAGHTKEGVKK